MRKCLRCDAKMREGLALYGSQSGWRTDLCEMRAFFPRKVGTLLAAVCPRCGYTELYIEELAQDKE